ncbi:AAA family ATPase [Halosimplex salinum]|uniref:AAA family ATPase n=1 Tax=Halosimplex salinum TaxID=1710538 RepID=UPI000F4688B5|nr:AAA family ATPase [Halosimplex salinum]
MADESEDTAAVDGPLWTETHAPALEDLPQPEVRDHLGSVVEEPMNLLVHGPPGAGKTAAVRALSDELHDNEADLVEINVADFFDMTKKEVSQDERFAQFIDSKRRRESSKADLINHVLKESASYAPVSGDYKTVLLDNAEGVREDFQQALRRVMEQYYEATQFVIATRQPSALIPPIRSRCFPVAVRKPTHDETVAVLEDIVEAEGADHDDEGIEYVAGYADGDLREAILAAQTTYEQEGSITMNNAYEVLGSLGADERVQEMVTAAEAGEFTDARSTLDDLLVDEGHSGEEVLEDVLTVARSRYSGPDLARVHRLAGEIDVDLHEGTSDRIHVSHLLAELGELRVGE